MANPIRFRKICATLLITCLGTQTALANGWILPTKTEPQNLVREAPKTQPAKTGWILKNNTAPKATPTVHIKDAAGNIRIIPSTRPIDELFRAGSIVMTGFSGFTVKHPLFDPELSLQDRAEILQSDDLKFIDLDGQSASLTQINNIGYGFNGDQVSQAPYDRFTARDVGQVFGIAIDDMHYPNLYLTASSVFGLQIVGVDKNKDLVLDRLTKGARNARWMQGQWGSFKGSGPGSVYKVEGATGQISLFSTIKLEERENTGAGLGNITYDAAHNQLFVSDLETGLIHRVDDKGQLLQDFDHGVAGRKAAKRSRVRFNPRSGINIEKSKFDSLDPKTWNIAKPERRVWGLAVRGTRLFYAVAQGPEIWSIGIDTKTGEMLDDPRWELTVTQEHQGFDVSDIVFSPSGAMILAQRPAVATAYDYKTFTTDTQAKVLRYVYESPKDDPETPSVWYEQPEVLPVGFKGDHNNGLGGIDLGPSYDDKGRIDWRRCNGSLLSTGQNLRNNKNLQDSLLKGGKLRLDGIQIAPRAIRAADNAPPWLSFLQDFNGEPHGVEVTGHVGDVEVLDCGLGAGAGVLADHVTDMDDVKDPKDKEFFCTRSIIAAGLCTCAVFPNLCFPKDPPKACLEITSDVVCNKTTGLYEFASELGDRSNVGFDNVKVEDPSGQISSLPSNQSFPGRISVDLSGLAPGQSGQLNLCAYNAADRASNAPYNCCNQTVNFKIPGEACVKEAE